MTAIKLLDAIRYPTKDGFRMPLCQCEGCNCDIRITYNTGSGSTVHKFVDDILTIGTKTECNAGTKDIVQSFAEGMIKLGWAKYI